MLITEKGRLKDFTWENRIWQGVPGIEVTKQGRIFAVFYSGGTKEELGNFAMLVMSDDGVNFTEPIAVAYDEKYRCFDPCLWIDPLDRLWFTWSVMPDDDVYATVCDNPDADELVWNESRVIGKGIMMNKPTVLSTGEWMFPIAMWSVRSKSLIEDNAFASEKNEKESGAFAYRSIDNGKTLTKLGGVIIPNRSFDEHMFVEFNEGHIGSYVRTTNGIGVSYSYDGGKTWTNGEDTGYGGPNSRFFIRRLKSGRILLINHYKYTGRNNLTALISEDTGRNNLTALLSEDEGKTWKYSLLLDEREEVSYPDAKEADDGFIYITYDRARGAFKNSFDEVYDSAREILYAKITEEDIISGKIQNPNSKLRCIINKLGRYNHEDENPFNEVGKFSDQELVDFLMDVDVEKILGKIFDIFSVNCINMQSLDNEKLDLIIDELKDEGADKKSKLLEIVKLVKSVKEMKKNDIPIVDEIVHIIQEDIQSELTLDEIAKQIGISQSYMMYCFKKATGLSINKYRNSLRIQKAKRMLIETDDSITQIANECGFGKSSYFSERFVKSEGVTPKEYRQLLKK